MQHHSQAYTAFVHLLLYVHNFSHESSRACQHQTSISLLQSADFGPRTSLKVVDQIRSKLKDGNLKNGEQIRSELKQSILELLRSRGGNTDLQLGDKQPSVILVVGVNGGGKTTTIGKLAHKFNSEGVKVRIVGVDDDHASCLRRCAKIMLAALTIFHQQRCCLQHALSYMP